MCVALGGVLAAGCGRRPPGTHHGPDDAGPSRPGTADAAADDPWSGAGEPPTGDRCAQLPFAASIPVPEASGAAWLAGSGGGDVDVVLVVGDSGHAGAYVEIAADDGRLLRRGALPLGAGVSDDLEGIASDGARLWGLTSGGWMRAWVRDGAGFRLSVGAYPIERAPPCGATAVNCGKNFEGLCVRPAGAVGSDGCAGYAASKTEGALYCLQVEDGRLVLAAGDDARPRPPGPVITAPGALADCAIAADGAVWTGDNAIGGAMVRRLDPAWSASLGAGFPEAMALGPDGVVFRFSDSSGTPSGATRHRCPANAAGPATRTIASATP